MSEAPQFTAGIHFPLKAVANLFSLVKSFTAFATLNGNQISNSLMGVYGIVDVELPNPDVEQSQRKVRINIKNKSDFKTLSRAQLDKGLTDGINELVLLYEYRKTFFGGTLPGFHVALYPKGTWDTFFKEVDKYKGQEFVWPKPLVLFRPTNAQAFPESVNLFKK